MNLSLQNRGENGTPPERNGQGGLEVRRDGLLLAEPKAKTDRPPFYKVVMLNDDYTPMDFVVHVLKSLFHRPHEDAISIMLDIHQKGSGICGIFPRDVAETKVDLVIAAAKKHEHPLQCVLEKN